MIYQSRVSKNRFPLNSIYSPPQASVRLEVIDRQWEYTRHVGRVGLKMAGDLDIPTPHLLCCNIPKGHEQHSSGLWLQVSWSKISCFQSDNQVTTLLEFYISEVKYYVRALLPDNTLGSTSVPSLPSPATWGTCLHFSAPQFPRIKWIISKLGNPCGNLTWTFFSCWTHSLAQRSSIFTGNIYLLSISAFSLIFTTQRLSATCVIYMWNPNSEIEWHG